MPHEEMEIICARCHEFTDDVHRCEGCQQDFCEKCWEQHVVQCEEVLDG